MKITKVYAFGEDREVTNQYHAHNTDRYFVPTLVVNDDITFGYNVVSFLPKIFDFLGVTKNYYRVALGTDKRAISYAKAYKGKIYNDPYNPEYKWAEFTEELFAHNTANTVGIWFVSDAMEKEKALDKSQQKP